MQVMHYKALVLFIVLSLNFFQQKTLQKYLLIHRHMYKYVDECILILTACRNQDVIDK